VLPDEALPALTEGATLSPLSPRSPVARACLSREREGARDGAEVT
jgi:hypothetical protein